MARSNILEDIVGPFKEGRGTPWALPGYIQRIIGSSVSPFEPVDVRQGWDVYMVRTDGAAGNASGDFVAVTEANPPFVMKGKCPDTDVLGRDLGVITEYLQERGRVPRASAALFVTGVVSALPAILAFVNDAVLHYGLNTPEIFPIIYNAIGYEYSDPEVGDVTTGAISFGAIMLAAVAIAASSIPSAIHSRQVMRRFSSMLSPQAAGYSTFATEIELYRHLNEHLLQQLAQRR